MWDSFFLLRGSDATTLSGYSYFNPKHNYFLLYLGGRCSPKGGAPAFSPTYYPFHSAIKVWNWSEENLVVAWLQDSMRSGHWWPVDLAWPFPCNQHCMPKWRHPGIKIARALKHTFRECTKQGWLVSKGVGQDLVPPAVNVVPPATESVATSHYFE